MMMFYFMKIILKTKLRNCSDLAWDAIMAIFQISAVASLKSLHDS